MDSNGAYLSIEDCPDGILTCQFNFEPNYESIIALFYMMAALFIALPLFIATLNSIFFEKIFCGKTLGQCCGSKKKVKQTKFESKIHKMEKTKLSQKALIQNEGG
jgi:hypothetical protein